VLKRSWHNKKKNSQLKEKKKEGTKEKERKKEEKKDIGNGERFSFLKSWPNQKKRMKKKN